mmetsp:Transcript_59680/g.176842  ORF Transcript_59680/g.176842 Transcript_59680/m.176842 type:complete len:93 (+) Transcript_59680:506-784(+)
MGPHDGSCHCAKVSDHFVAVPSPNEPNGVHANLPKQDGHGDTCAQGEGGDSIRVEPNGVANVASHSMEGCYEFHAADTAPLLRGADCTQKCG